MKFFDSNITVGRKIALDYTPIDNEIELLNLMDEHGIDKALIIHADQRNVHPEIGNQIAVDFTKSDRIEKVFALLPAATCEFDYDVLSYMKENKIKAITVFPKYMNFFMNKVCMGKQLDEIVERKIPIILSLYGEMDWADMYAFMKDYPEATVIIKDLYDWAQDRYYYPLLVAYKNLYMETNKMSLVASGIEDATKRFGSHRFVFGTAYPRCYISASKMDLMHARIKDSDKENIAYNNLERLLNNADLS